MKYREKVNLVAIIYIIIAFVPMVQHLLDVLSGFIVYSTRGLIADDLDVWGAVMNSVFFICISFLVFTSKREGVVVALFLLSCFFLTSVVPFLSYAVVDTGINIPHVFMLYIVRPILILLYSISVRGRKILYSDNVM